MATDVLTSDFKQHCLELLSASEHARHDRYLDARARDQYLIGRAMVRTVLSRHVDVEPSQWVFGCNTYGRPHIASPSLATPLHFNLSHTSGLVALAVSEAEEIGIDVECLNRRLSWEDLAVAYYSPEERAMLAQADAHQRKAVFFDIWTLREAYIKARGLGLSRSFESFQFSFSNGEVVLQCNDGCDDNGSRWRFFCSRPTPSHVMSVAVAGREPTIAIKVLSRDFQDVAASGSTSAFIA